MRLRALTVAFGNPHGAAERISLRKRKYPQRYFVNHTPRANQKEGSRRMPLSLAVSPAFTSWPALDPPLPHSGGPRTLTPPRATPAFKLHPGQLGQTPTQGWDAALGGVLVSHDQVLFHPQHLKQTKNSVPCPCSHDPVPHSATRAFPVLVNGTEPVMSNLFWFLLIKSSCFIP